MEPNRCAVADSNIWGDCIVAPDDGVVAGSWPLEIGG